MSDIHHYEAIGPVRGSCGHKHRTEEAAEACAERDAAAIRKRYPSQYPTCAYSDRSAVAVDEHGRPVEGWLSDAELDAEIEYENALARAADE